MFFFSFIFFVILKYFIFFLEYDLLRDISGAQDVCIKKQTYTSFHLFPEHNFQECMYQLRLQSSPLCVLKLSSVDIELPHSQVPLSIFYSGKNIVVLACHVSFGDSFQFCRKGLKKLILWKYFSFSLSGIFISEFFSICLTGPENKNYFL